MPRYYFALSNEHGSIKDTEGTELPNLAAAWREAMEDVKHLRQPRIGGRRSWAGWAVQVQDQAGVVLFEVAFTKSAARA